MTRLDDVWMRIGMTYDFIDTGQEQYLKWKIIT